MKLTTKGRYSIQAILDLANNCHGKAVRLTDISDRQKISLQYLEQLFHKLRKAGVVKSVRGRGGGYVLAQEAGAITVESILRGVEELIEYQTALKFEDSPTKEQLSISGYLGKMDSAMLTCLNTTIGELIQ